MKEKEQQTYTLFEHRGIIYILTPCTRTKKFVSDGEKIPQANFMGTGLALVGILKNGQTLDDFLEQRKARKSEIKKRVDATINEFKRKQAVSI